MGKSDKQKQQKSNIVWQNAYALQAFESLGKCVYECLECLYVDSQQPTLWHHADNTQL